jgi:hypothetical protein
MAKKASCWFNIFDSIKRRPPLKAITVRLIFSRLTNIRVVINIIKATRV